MRIALHADPLAAERGRDAPHRARPRERIQHRAPPRRHREQPADHRIGRGVPEALGMRARQGQRPAERDAVGTDRPTRLAEPQEMVHPVVPALARAHLRPEALGLERPPAAPERGDHEPVDADPLDAVVPVPDDQPQVAVGGQDPSPLPGESGRELLDVAPGLRAPPPADPVRGRGEDDSDAARLDRIEPTAVPHEEAQPSVAAGVALHAGMDGVPGRATRRGRLRPPGGDGAARARRPPRPPCPAGSRPGRPAASPASASRCGAPR